MAIDRLILHRSVVGESDGTTALINRSLAVTALILAIDWGGFGAIKINTDRVRSLFQVVVSRSPSGRWKTRIHFFVFF